MPGNRFQIGEYWLSQRSNSPKWYVTYYARESRQTCRETLGTSDLEEAKLLLAQWVTVKGERRNVATSDARVEDIFIRYFEHRRTRIQGASQQRRALYRFLDACGGPTTVADLTLRRQEAIIERLKATEVIVSGEHRRLSGGTIQRTLAACKAAINWAWKNGELERPIPFLSFQDHAVRERALEIEELAALWDATENDHLRMFLVLMVGTVARPKAVLELTREQCHLDDGFINLNPPGRSQTAKRRPAVPLVPSLAPFIASRHSGPLVQFRGKAILKINSAWRKMRDLAGLDADVVPYSIRHMMITEMDRRGVPGTIISAVAGHNEHSILRGRAADVASRTTQRYIHRQLPTLQPAADAIEAVLQELQAATKRPFEPPLE